MATRVGLESYEILACHGVFDFEREKTQPFVISIWATLVEDVKDMKEDLTELKYTLLNPEDGVIVKTNLNTAFRSKLEAGDKDFQEKLKEVELNLERKTVILKFQAVHLQALLVQAC